MATVQSRGLISMVSVRESQLHTPLGPSFCSLGRALRGVNRGLIFSSGFRKHLFKSVFN